MSTFMSFLPLLITLIIGVSLAVLCSKVPESNVNFSEDQNTKRLSSEFRGSTGEYVATFFKVVVLNVITVGLYSPWGTVKLRKLLLNNTYIGNNSFDYHATPISILKGRLIIAGVLITVSVLAAVNPIAYAVALLGLIVVAPILTYLGLKFKYRNHSFAGIRFEFNGNLGDAFKLTYGLILGGITTLTLAVPIFSRFSNSYVLNNSRWGDRSLGIKTNLKDFYSAYGKSLLFFLVGVVLVILLFLLLASLFDNESFSVWHWMVLAIYFLLPMTIALYQWFIFSILANSLCVDRTLNSECSLTFPRISKVVLGNFFGVIFTLGIYYPWAKIRAHRLMISSVTMRSTPSISEIRHRPEKDTSGITDEIASTVYDVSL